MLFRESSIHVTTWSALLSVSFQICSVSDVADDLGKSKAGCVLAASYYVFPHCVGLCDGGLVDGSFLPCSGGNVLFLQLYSFTCSSLLFSLLRIAFMWLVILCLILLMQLWLSLIVKEYFAEFINSVRNYVRRLSRWSL